MCKDILQKESEFHDGWARAVEPKTVKIDALKDACTMPETRYILDKIRIGGGRKY